MRAKRKQELELLVGAMKSAAGSFYQSAFAIGVHTFIEFTGLMVEFANLCDDALKQGIDYEEISVHSGPKRLPTFEFRLTYLGNKFGCIFSQWLRDPKAFSIFLRAADLGHHLPNTEAYRDDLEGARGPQS